VCPKLQAELHVISLLQESEDDYCSNLFADLDDSRARLESGSESWITWVENGPPVLAETVTIQMEWWKDKPCSCLCCGHQIEDPDHPSNSVSIAATRHSMDMASQTQGVGAAVLLHTLSAKSRQGQRKQIWHRENCISRDHLKCTLREAFLCQ
jgi:hypothetical protein